MRHHHEHKYSENAAMRLTSDQIQAIRHAANTAFGEGTAVWLFGSRVDDAKKGGAIVSVAHQTGIRLQ